MKIGFTSNSFRQIKSVEKIVEIAVDTGADCIEWGADVHVKDVAVAKKAKELCDKSGIAVSSYGSYYRVGSKNADEWKNICEIASALGAKSVRVWLGNADSEKTDSETYKALVEDAKSMCAAAEEFGLIICPECHDNTFNNNTDAFLKIQKDIGCDNFRTYFQSRYRRREYDLDRIERTLPHTESVHVSFFDLTREQFPKFNPKYMNTLLEKLIEVGFDGNILVEFTFVGFRYGLPSAMKKDIKKLRKIIGQAKNSPDKN